MSYRHFRGLFGLTDGGVVMVLILFIFCLVMVCFWVDQQDSIRKRDAYWAGFHAQRDGLPACVYPATHRTEWVDGWVASWKENH